MIPVLFKKDEYEFSHMGKGLLYEALSCSVTEVRNGRYELEMEYPMKSSIDIELLDIILCKPNSYDNNHIFRIYDIETNSVEETLYVKAMTVNNDLADTLIPEFEINEGDTLQDIETKFNETLPEGRFKKLYRLKLDNRLRREIVHTKWKYASPLVILHEMLGKLFFGDVIHENFAITVYPTRGADNGVVIRYGKNLDGYRIAKSIKSLKTRVIGTIPKPEEENTSGNTGETNDAKLNPSFLNTQPDLIYSKVVDSKYIDVYPHPYMSLIDCSDKEDLKTKEQLDDYIEHYFTSINPGCDRPSISIDVDLFQLSELPEYHFFKELEHISLGDTVTVLLDAPVKLRVTEVVYDVLREKTQSIKAGQIQQSLYKQQTSNLETGLKSVIKYTDNVRNTIIPMMNGKNKIYRGFEEPRVQNAIDGDLWYKLRTQNGSEASMHIFKGGSWTPISYDANDITTGNLNLNNVNLVGLSANHIGTGTLRISNELKLSSQDSGKEDILSVDNLGNVVFSADVLKIKDNSIGNTYSRVGSYYETLQAAERHMQELIGRIQNSEESGMYYVNELSNQHFLFKLPTNSEQAQVKFSNGGIEAFKGMFDDSIHIGNVRIEAYSLDGIAFRYVKRGR